MGMTAADYKDQLAALLPHGPAWPRIDADWIQRLLSASAQELARVDARVDDLIKEDDPRTTSEMLPDWERNYGLPDDCLTPAAGADERRRRLHQRVSWRGGQSVAFFVSMLDSLGYPGCTITEFRPMRVNSKCNAPINQGGWRYAWRINVPASVNVKALTVTGRVNEPLAAWGDPGLACLLAKYKPAHTYVFISYEVTP